ncbi:MAG: iron-containing alcohol dehydrogenase [Pseudomonadota bacterium]
MGESRSHVLSPVPPLWGGPGSLKKIGSIVEGLVDRSKPVFMIADPGLPAGFADEARGLLTASGYDVAVFDDFSPDPTFGAAHQAASIAQQLDAAAIVGIGGGSALDLAKAVAVAARHALSLEDFALGAAALPTTAPPLVAIPTTAGTGSEATRTAVLADASGAKLWLWGDCLKPRAIILDPALTIGLPPFLTAATGMDALVHAIEAATNRNATSVNSVLALAAIRLVAEHLPIVVEQPDNVASREAMQMAAAYAGAAIDNAGTAIAHAIGHALGSRAKLHHGHAVSCAMSATLPWNVQGDGGRFGEVAKAMGGSGDGAELPGLFDALFRRVGLSHVLNLAGEIDAKDLVAQIRRPENKAMLASNWRAPTEVELLAFARKVLGES